MSRTRRERWAWPAALFFFALPCLGFGCGKVLDIPEYGLRPGADGVECDSKSDQNFCGLSANGKPKTCFAASQLGGRDTCTDACDVSQGSPDPSRFACLATGALLQICDPKTAESCPAGLNCFRTEIWADTLHISSYPKQVAGVCIAMPVCTYHSECDSQPTRRLCASELLRDKVSPFEVLFHTDNLQCIQSCDDPAHKCPTGQRCLSELLDSSLPKVCVPTCDSGTCPPNSFCLRNAGPGYPAMCAPGLPGFRCTSAEDCILGYCADTGAGFNLCTVPCAMDADCTILNKLREPFMCLRPSGSGPPSGDSDGICVAKGPFAGAACFDSGDCPTDQHCSDYEPYNPSVQRTPPLECRRRCDSNRHCSRIGNMPYVCLANGECYPGDMGLACTSTEECMGALTCETVEQLSTLDGSAGLRICTRPCRVDSECVGYGNSPKLCRDGFCRLPSP